MFQTYLAMYVMLGVLGRADMLPANCLVTPELDALFRIMAVAVTIYSYFEACKAWVFNFVGSVHASCSHACHLIRLGGHVHACPANEPSIFQDASWNRAAWHTSFRGLRLKPMTPSAPPSVRAPSWRS
jgi:hypothetical protein